VAGDASGAPSFRREANEFDSAAHSKAVDSLLNYETVKYFNNEAVRGAALRREPGAACGARSLKSQQHAGPAQRRVSS
jgi:hypothetical protein